MKSIDKTAAFIVKARKIHGDRYDYSKVDYKNINTHIIIICSIHGEFRQNPGSHIHGRHGCRKCSTKKNAIRQTKDTNWFVTHAKEKHGDLYDYSLVNYISAKKDKVIIICNKPNHGQFSRFPADHLSKKNKNGCPKCGYERVSAALSSDTDTFIMQARKRHGDIYDYSKVDYKTNRIPVCIICKKHGEFMQKPDCHSIAGHGCPTCGIDATRCTNDEFIERAIDRFGNTYDYSKTEYIHCNQSVIIGCPTHGFFEQTPFAHLHSNGCNKCWTRGYSRKAIKWLESIIKAENIDMQHAENGGEYKIPTTKWYADGYCKETNTIYEYMGCYFHGCNRCFNPSETNESLHATNECIYNRTMARIAKLREMGYNVIIRWEHEDRKRLRPWMEKIAQNCATSPPNDPSTHSA